MIEERLELLEERVKDLQDIRKFFKEGKAFLHLKEMEQDMFLYLQRISDEVDKFNLPFKDSDPIISNLGKLHREIKKYVTFVDKHWS